MPQYTPMVIRGRGGALPQYQQRVQHYAPGQAISARIDDSSIGIRLRGAQAAGEGMSKLPEAIEKAGRTAGAIADQYGRIKALQAFRGYQEEMNWTLYNKDSGLLSTTKGESAFDVEKRIRDAQQRLHKKYLGDGVGSVFGIEMYFNQNAYEYDQRTYQQGMQHSASEYTKWVPQQLLASADEDVTEARMNYSDPDVVQRSLDRAMAKTAAAMHRQGATPAEIGNALQKIRHDYDLTTIDGAIAAGDDGYARQRLESGTRSSRNLANNNFGNVKTVKGGDASYATRHDGLMAVGDRVLRYSNAPENGWHAQSLVEMTSIYAPASDGNDPRGYAKFLAQKLGLGGPNMDWKDEEAVDRVISQKMDWRNPNVLAGLIQAMPIMEHGAGRVSIGRDEALAAAKDLLNGGRPRQGAPSGRDKGAPGEGAPLSASALTPFEIETRRDRLDALDRKRENERQQQEKAEREAFEKQRQDEVLTNVAGWIDATKGAVNDAARESYLYDRIQGVDDPKLRQLAEQYVDRALKEERAVAQKRQDAALVSATNYIRANLADVGQAVQYMKQAGIPASSYGNVLDACFGRREDNASTRAALDAVKRAVDQGRIKGVDDIETAGFYSRMTDAQIKDAVNYFNGGGKAAGFPLSSCESLWRSVTKASKGAEMPDGLYDAALSFLEEGRKPTDKEKRVAVQRAILDGYVLTDGGEYYGSLLDTSSQGMFARSVPQYEAMSGERQGEWVPRFTKEEGDRIRAYLSATDEKYKGKKPGDIPDAAVARYKRDHPDEFPIGG